MMQIHWIEADTKKNRWEVLMTTNIIQDAIEKNNIIFSKKWEATHDWIDHHLEDILLLKNRVVDLEALSGLQQTALQSSQNTIARLEETVTQLTTSVRKLEKSICQCHNWLLLPGPHYAPGEEEEMIEETKEEGDEEDGLEYETDAPSGDSYTTPSSTGGCSLPSPAPSCSPTLGDSNPENNTVLHTKEPKARIEAFLEEAEEDLEMNDLPLLKNTLPLPVLAPLFPGFIPFAVSTGQHCVPPKSLLRRVYHPYKDPVGQCCCEPGGWCNNLPCSGQVQHVPRKIRGHGLSYGSSQSGQSCCSTEEEPCNQQGASCGRRTPTHALCPGSLEL